MRHINSTSLKIDQHCARPGGAVTSWGRDSITLLHCKDQPVTKRLCRDARGAIIKKSYGKSGDKVLGEDDERGVRVRRHAAAPASGSIWAKASRSSSSRPTTWSIFSASFSMRITVATGRPGG